MAGKRINKEAPLTAAEKQKRYRQKREEELKEAKAQEMDEKIRELKFGLMARINATDDYDTLYNIAYYIIRGKPYNRVSENELKQMLGISDYEFDKLVRQGVIEPDSEKDIERDTKLTFAELLEGVDLDFLNEK